MNNSEAVVTIATLAALFENMDHRSKDYLDVISPFVSCCLPSRVGSPVDIFAVKSKMESEFAFKDFPLGVLRTILKRLSRQDPPLIIQSKENHYNYVLARKNPKDEFKAKFRRCRENMEKVSTDIASFLLREYGIKCKVDEAKAYLLNGFEKLFSSILKQESELNYRNNSEVLRVAKFIFQEKEKASSTFDKIEELTRGFVVYRAIYYFETQVEVVSSFSLNNISVYLDTPLLIDAMGYSTNDNQKVVNDLLPKHQKSLYRQGCLGDLPGV